MSVAVGMSLKSRKSHGLPFSALHKQYFRTLSFDVPMSRGWRAVRESDCEASKTSPWMVAADVISSTAFLAVGQTCRSWRYREAMCCGVWIIAITIDFKFLSVLSLTYKTKIRDSFNYFPSYSNHGPSFTYSRASSNDIQHIRVIIKPTVNARVCKQWSDIALDILWREIDELYIFFGILALLTITIDSEECYVSG